MDWRWEIVGVALLGGLSLTISIICRHKRMSGTISISEFRKRLKKIL